MMTTDIEGLHATLDLDPSDQETRRVLADAYEDAGDWVMADGLRWMAAEGKYPHKWRRSRKWGWLELMPGKYPLRHAGIPPVFFDALVRAYRNLPRSPTRRAAEEALCRALAGEVTR